MSRPCTDWPITRVSVTNDGATVVVVEGAVVEMVVDGCVEVVVLEGAVLEVAGDGVVDVVVAEDVTITVEACVPGATDADVPDPDEHDNIACDETASAHHHSRFVIEARLVNSG